MVRVFISLFLGGVVLAAEPHWAFQPLRPSEAGLIDSWVAESLAASGLESNPPADRRSLSRRLAYTLTGLPPTKAEMDAFLADTRADAFEREVERLLSSPGYAERWARVWLDVARYADSNGQDENKVMANAWRYRNWVIDAVRRDLPFADFVTHQLAGDLVPGLDEEARTRAITATGFLVLGPKRLAEQDKDKMVHDIVDEQIDTTGRAFLGMTLGCARCHDHKFDPVSQEDYFALAGIFHSTRSMADRAHVSKWNELDIASEAERAAHATHQQAVASNKEQLETLRREATTALKQRILMDAPRYAAATNAAGLIPEVYQRWQSALAKSPLKEFATQPDMVEQLVSLSQLEVSSLARGVRGGAMRCKDGHHLDVAHDVRFEPSELSLEAWVKIRSPSDESDTRRWVVNKNENEWEVGHYALVIDGDEAVAYIAPEGGRETQIKVSGGKLSRGSWHHLSCTYDGRRLILYVDGKRVAASPEAERPRRPSTGLLRIGGRADSYSNGDGLDIDEVRLYERALSGDEIASRFAAPDAPALAGQLGAWSFDPGSEAEMLALDQADVIEAARPLFDLPLKPRDHWTAEQKAELARLDSEKTRLKDHPPPPLASVMAVSEADMQTLKIHRRGDHLRPTGEPVPRGVPARLAPGLAMSVPDAESGRLALAEWMVHPDHPLTARVFVNRIWQAHFGRGLVDSPDNFGPHGEAPSHPELLDGLAAQFLKSGGSLKALHRLIVHSATWQQSSAVQPLAMEADPGNRLLWRMPMRRLEVEALRDSLLAVSGQLDSSMGGDPTESANYGYVRDRAEKYDTTRRSIYLPVLRARLYEVFGLFDFPQPSASSSKRDVSEVPLQSLFFMNSPLIEQCSEALAESLVGSDRDKAWEAIERVLLRAPTDVELQRAIAWVEAGGSWADFCKTLFSTNEFIYVD